MPPGTGQQRRLGDVQLSSTLLNWAHLYQHLRRRVPDGLYRSDAAVERIEATPHGTTLHLPGGSLDFDLVVCADGYRAGAVGTGGTSAIVGARDRGEIIEGFLSVVRDARGLAVRGQHGDLAGTGHDRPDQPVT